MFKGDHKDTRKKTLTLFWYLSFQLPTYFFFECLCWFCTGKCLLETDKYMPKLEQKHRINKPNAFLKIFKVNNKDLSTTSIHTVLMSLLLTLKIFHTTSSISIQYFTVVLSMELPDEISYPITPYVYKMVKHMSKILQNLLHLCV